MVLAASGADAQDLALGAVEDVELVHLFGARGRSRPVPVDALPGVRLLEGELVRRDAYYGTVLGVPWEQVERQLALVHPDHVRQARGTAQEGAGKAGEGVEVEVVGDDGDCVQEALSTSVTFNRSVGTKETIPLRQPGR